MLLYRTKIGRLKNLTFAEVHKLIKSLPDGIGADYREMRFGKNKHPQGVKHIVTIYRKNKRSK